MLDKLIECDKEWRRNLTELNELRHQRRKITNEIAQLKKKGEDITGKIEEARREFNRLYGKLDIELAQTRCPGEWNALSDQKKIAESEYAKADRWNSDSEELYKSALIKLKSLMKNIDINDDMYVSKKRCDDLYGKVNAGVANKWFADEWNAVRDQKKKAEAAYQSEDPDKDDVRVYYNEASQMLEDLLVKISDEAKKSYDELCNMINLIEGNLVKLEENLYRLDQGYQDEWKELQDLVDKAEMEYRKPNYWESGGYNAYISAYKKLFHIYKEGKDKSVILDFNDFKLKEYDDKMKFLEEDVDAFPSAATNEVPNL